MAKESINLPRSSYENLKKVIKGYGHLGQEVDLTTLSKLIKMNKVDISAQNGFLSQVGIIEGSGKKKLQKSERSWRDPMSIIYNLRLNIIFK